MLLGEDLEFPYDYGILFMEDKSNSPKLDNDWSKDDDATGCKFTDGSLQFLTLNQREFGLAILSVYDNEYLATPNYQRVIQMPLTLRGDVLAVSAVDGYRLDIKLEPGNYKIVIAQEFLGVDEETDGGKQRIDIFATKADPGSIERRVLIADEEISAGGRGLAS